jgi:hypothetical protein
LLEERDGRLDPGDGAHESISWLRRQESSSMLCASALTLATKMPRPPSAAAASATQARSALASATPPQLFTPLPVSAITVSSTAASWRAQSATLQPSSANSSAIARPMPRVPPV